MRVIMSKTVSGIFFGTSLVALFGTAAVYITLRPQFGTIGFDLGFVIALVALFFITSVLFVDFIIHFLGLKINRKSTISESLNGRSESLNGNDKQFTVAIDIPTDKVSSIRKYNIHTLHVTHDTKDNTSPKIQLTYSEGLFDTPQNIKTQKISLITSSNPNEIKDKIDSPALLITAQHDTIKQALTEKQVKENLITRCIPIIWTDSKLSLEIYYARPYDEIHNPKDYRSQELLNLLTTPAVSKDSIGKSTVYDFVASHILEQIDELAPEDTWYNTKESKIAIRFFTRFGKFNTINIKILTNQSQHKLQKIFEYIEHQGKTLVEHDEHDKIILDYIKDAYFKHSYDTHHYSHLWKNRLTKDSSHILEILQNRINIDTEFQFICLLATHSAYDTNSDNDKTNTAITELLSRSATIKPLPDITHITTVNNISKIIHIDNYDDNIKEILQILSNKKKSCTLRELIENARTYVTNFCEPHMMPYIERKINITQAKVNSVTLVSEQPRVNPSKRLITADASLLNPLTQDAPAVFS
ncbi:hypothetical protein FDZ58_01555 [Ehrlichia ruminantium]|nr:hypothetical protein FDZ68_01545 [Ehrlichia ruminantium]QLK51281.1 hypothetical protein FDZ66_01550 [Ehrlichia ruminantium]QLK53116.1 hypothetical protein FDZ64_01550 [Ehrlichia ruminantium]QLK58619.1 hypothetical protein FDZ58_01555 [Ehrlichia ruminantium]